MNEDEAVTSIHRKIDREKALINAANTMRQSTSNQAVLSRLETQIRDGRRNIEYLEGRLRELQMKRMGSDMENLHIRQGSTGAALGPDQVGQRKGGNPLTPPPKDGFNSNSGYVDQGGYGDATTNYSGQLSGGQGLMPPRAPFTSGPGQQKTRQNYSKLGRTLKTA